MGNGFGDFLPRCFPLTWWRRRDGRMVWPMFYWARNVYEFRDGRRLLHPWKRGTLSHRFFRGWMSRCPVSAVAFFETTRRRRQHYRPCYDTPSAFNPQGPFPWWEMDPLGSKELAGYRRNSKNSFLLVFHWCHCRLMMYDLLLGLPQSKAIRKQNLCWSTSNCTHPASFYFLQHAPKELFSGAAVQRVVIIH